MTKSINIKIKGQEDNGEYKAGQELKGIFEKSLPQEVVGDITIVSNVTLIGQEFQRI